MALPNDNMTREMLAAQAHIWNHTFSYINSMPLKCAIQLGIQLPQPVVSFYKNLTTMTLPNDNLTTEMLAAQAHIWNHTFIYINSMSLKCSIELGIPSIIHSNGRAMTLSDLVNALPINNNAKTLNYIFCLICILVHGGFFN
ncbi:hypothetical protein KY290_036831 [Solanum tuberosum]|uniref:O-methyltransferase dimerisation domain-containing protein n=1 Tax=Solanum tuberosum TaxID=4113 RepID=A0ABQ7TUA6_SOLTU|nr:hypothetical protein KY285_036150 [Solanum tuberosum]KAH0738126.1 hypothetical protein KY290_036831 [Solanum tuberosum]